MLIIALNSRVLFFFGGGVGCLPGKLFSGVYLIHLIGNKLWSQLGFEYANGTLQLRVLDTVQREEVWRRLRWEQPRVPW